MVPATAEVVLNDSLRRVLTDFGNFIDMVPKSSPNQPKKIASTSPT